MYALSIRAHLNDELLDLAFSKLEKDGLLGATSTGKLQSEY